MTNHGESTISNSGETDKFYADYYEGQVAEKAYFWGRRLPHRRPRAVILSETTNVHREVNNLDYPQQYRKRNLNLL